MRDLTQHLTTRADDSHEVPHVAGQPGTPRHSPPRRGFGRRLTGDERLFLRFFTWWNGANLNTLYHTRRHGELVGHDEFGNAYYRTRGGKIDPALGFERRWVIYNGVSEASMTPPGWNGWLHHTVDTPPTRRRLQAARMGEAAHRQSHRHAGGDSAQGFDDAAAAARQARAAIIRPGAGRLTAPPSFRPALPPRGADAPRRARKSASPTETTRSELWRSPRGLAALLASRPPARPTRSSIRPPSSPGSTRSPAESSPSRSRSTRPCSSARCRSRRASATRGPPTEAPQTDAFAEVDEVESEQDAQAHFHRLDVRRQPRPARRRASRL